MIEKNSHFDYILDIDRKFDITFTENEVRLQMWEMRDNGSYNELIADFPHDEFVALIKKLNNSIEILGLEPTASSLEWTNLSNDHGC